MAIVNCLSCGNLISDKAISCPKCGNSYNCAVLSSSVENQSSDKLGLKALLNISGVLAIIFSAIGYASIFFKIESETYAIIWRLLSSIAVYCIVFFGFSLLIMARKTPFKTIAMCGLILSLILDVYWCLYDILPVLTYYSVMEYNETIFSFLTSRDIYNIASLSYPYCDILFLSGCIFLYRKTIIIYPLIIVSVLIINVIVYNLITIDIDIIIFNIIQNCIRLIFGLWVMLINKKTWLKLVNSQRC